jgi:hypothetical protein
MSSGVQCRLPTVHANNGHDDSVAETTGVRPDQKYWSALHFHRLHLLGTLVFFFEFFFKFLKFLEKFKKRRYTY